MHETRTPAAELLEFAAIKRRAAERSTSAEAAELLEMESPLSDPAAVTEQNKRVAALCALLKDGAPPCADLPRIGFLLPKLGVEGAALDLDEAFALGLFAERGEALRLWLVNSERLRPLAEETPSAAETAAEVFAVLDREGRVKDLPEIKKIRRRITELSRALENAGARYAADEETRRMLQSPLPSQRDGRLVLAVKANFRGRIKGIVHEVSSSGQTLFIEPEESVEKNNLLLVERGNLEAEIRRVLRGLSERLASGRVELAEFHRRILYFETLRAKARYSLETRGTFAGSSSGSSPGAERLVLKEARHPLLGPDAVPVDIAMNGSTRAVIITGPNTGGKTVTLKTIGLFALMNQWGLALPAAEGTALPVFDAVFADIGDDQSISQSLSTFSAHMINIASIVKSAGERSLVLLDELGSGTDPEEGGAIAMALLDHFIEKKSTVVVTTHHGALKNYGYGREGVENASVEFDGRTLSPTYRIIMGLPGESRALDIAERNGLPPELAAKARAFIGEERSNVSALISGLKEKHRELDAASQKAVREEQRIREEQRKADLRELSLRQKEHFLKAEGAGQLRRLLGESRQKLENLVRELREGEISREKTLRVKEFIRGLEEDSAAIDAALDAGEAALKNAAGESAGSRAASGTGGGANANGMNGTEIAPGVEVTAGKRRGRVIRPGRKAGTWIVEVGAVKMSFPEQELVPAKPLPRGEIPLIAAAELSTPARAAGELNLLGMRLDEARDALRRQIDAAVLSGLSSFAVIHGKGDGILQKGVHDFLEGEDAVSEFFFSRPELGGAGRTEVRLKG